MGQHSHQDGNPGRNASGLLETLPLHPREEWERYNVLDLNCKEHKWEMKMNSVEMVDELQDKAGSLSWSNTLVTPLGHYTCWGSFGFCFYSKSASPLQQHKFSLSSRNEDWYDCASDMPDKIKLHRQGIFFCATRTSGLTPTAHQLWHVHWRAEGSSHRCPISGTSTAGQWRQLLKGAHLLQLAYSLVTGYTLPFRALIPQYSTPKSSLLWK